jgi:hypothetical protein
VHDDSHGKSARLVSLPYRNFCLPAEHHPVLPNSASWERVHQSLRVSTAAIKSIGQCMRIMRGRRRVRR